MYSLGLACSRGPLAPGAVGMLAGPLFLWECHREYQGWVKLKRIGMKCEDAFVYKVFE